MNEIAIALLDIINFVAFILFLVLVGAILFSIIRRLTAYKLAHLPIPTLVKMSLVLFGALAVLGFEAAVLRVLGINIADSPVARLVYTIQSDVIMLTALGYYAKAELFDVDDPDKP